MSKNHCDWMRVSSRHPCPVCLHSSWCSTNRIRNIVYCMRAESDKPGKYPPGGWIHPLDVNHQQSDSFSPVYKPKSTEERREFWETVALGCHRESGAQVKALAIRLGVARWALDALQVGYGNVGGRWCWTFPECNHNGEVLGMQRLLVEPLENTNKLYSPGGRRGLYYEDDWQKSDGPVLIVEGGTDAAAGLTLGRCVIGRPAVMGGLNYLVPMLRRFDKDRRIIVVAERDRKSHSALPELVRRRHSHRCKGCMECWPGRAGAITMARQLRRQLSRRVEWQFMPGGAKDMRDWFNELSIDPEDKEATFEAGARLFT